jgi:hypothetical protein
MQASQVAPVIAIAPYHGAQNSKGCLEVIIVNIMIKSGFIRDCIIIIMFW